MLKRILVIVLSLSILFSIGISIDTFDYRANVWGLLLGNTYSTYAETTTSAAINLIVSDSDTEVPNAPENLITIARDYSSITITWDESADDTYISSYLVTFNDDIVYETTDTYYTFSGLELGNTYEVNVRAIDSAGNTSPASANLSIDFSIFDSGLLTNGGFENGTDGWSLYDNSSSPDFINSSGVKLGEDGQFFYNLNVKRIESEDAPGNLWPAIYQQFNAKVGSIYKLSFEYRINRLSNKYSDSSFLSKIRICPIHKGYYLSERAELLLTESSVTDEWIHVELTTTFTQDEYENLSGEMIALNPFFEVWSNNLETIGDVTDIDLRNISVFEIDTEEPSVPNNVSATLLDAESLEITWDNSTDNISVEGYKIKYNGEEIADITGTTYLIDSPSLSQVHEIEICAYDSAGNISEYSETLEIPANWIPVEEMTVETSSEETVYEDNSGANVLDFNESTIWHTEWENYGEWPQSITFNLGEIYLVDSIAYQPRQDSSHNGIITDYAIYTSIDGEFYGKVSEGSWDADRDTKYELFNQTAARFVKLEALGSIYNKYASAAEIRIFSNNSDEEEPSVPRGLVAVTKSQTGIDLKWNEATDNVGIEYYVLTVNEEEITGIVDTSYTIDGLSMNSVYDITVKAIDSSGNESEPSELLSVTTLPLEAPMDITIASDIYEATISFSSAAEAIAYELAIGEETYIVNGLSYTITGLIPESVYSVKVRTLSEEDTSEWSEAISFTTLALPDLEGPTYESFYAETDVVTDSTFELYVEGIVDDASGVDKVIYEVWLEGAEESTVLYDALLNSIETTWIGSVNIEDHNSNEGTYHVRAYLYDESGNITKTEIIQVTVDMTAPTCSNISVSEISTINTQFQVYANNVVDTVTGVKEVYFHVWTALNGQDDLVIKKGVYDIETDSWSLTVDVSDHDNEEGIYYIQVLCSDNAGNSVDSGTVEVTVSDETLPTVDSISISSDVTTEEYFSVYANDVKDDMTGIHSVEFLTWTENGGQDDLTTTLGIYDEINNCWYWQGEIAAHDREEGIYITEVHIIDKAGNELNAGQIMTRVILLREETITIEAAKGEEIELLIRAKDLLESGPDRITLTYDSDKLKVVDLNAATKEEDMESGSQQNGITIESHSEVSGAGQLVLSIEKNIAVDKYWSGVIQVIKFEGVVTGSSGVSVIIE